MRTKAGLLLAFLLIVLNLASCDSIQPSQINQASKFDADQSTQTAEMLAKSTAATQVIETTATNTPSPIATRIPTPIPLSDPILEELLAAGYTQGDLIRFFIGRDTGGMLFGGPDFDNPLPPQLDIDDEAGNTYSYIQYENRELNNCHLLFFYTDTDGTRLIHDVDASKINERIASLTVSPVDQMYPAPLGCLPYGWGDVNENGNIDIAVSFLWGNNIDGSEVHIFEVRDGTTIVDLMANLPGVISPWDYDPYYLDFLVIDLAWVHHDCIYPPIRTFWIYYWDGDAYVDQTSQFDLQDYLTSIADGLRERHGSPFVPARDIDPLVKILVMYDKWGRRDDGWQLYEELSDPVNWPGTDEESLRWLEADIAHFRGEYEAGLDFTPNDYCQPY
jgi:hypothetical protein